MSTYFASIMVKVKKLRTRPSAPFQLPFGGGAQSAVSSKLKSNLKSTEHK